MANIAWEFVKLSLRCFVSLPLLVGLPQAFTMLSLLSLCLVLLRLLGRLRLTLTLLSNILVQVPPLNTILGIIFILLLVCPSPLLLGISWILCLLLVTLMTCMYGGLLLLSLSIVVPIVAAFVHLGTPQFLSPVLVAKSQSKRINSIGPTGWIGFISPLVLHPL